MNHPYTFASPVGLDIYLNPWWGLETLRKNSGRFVLEMSNVLGAPDLWYNGHFHELLWGPRDIPRPWRPSFHVNLSGTNGKIWRCFWFPWRGKSLKWVSGQLQPFAANLLAHDIMPWDLDNLERYVQFIPSLQLWASEGCPVDSRYFDPLVVASLV